MNALTKHGNLTPEQSLEIQAAAAVATRVGVPANRVTMAIMGLLSRTEPAGRLLMEMKEAMRGEEGATTASPVPPDELPIGGTIFILHSYDAFLMEQRSDIGEYDEEWFFPGGKIEDGETPFDTLKREMSEELGCAPIHHCALRPVLRPVMGKSRYRMQPFLVTKWDGDVPTESLDKTVPLQWIHAKDIAVNSPVPVVCGMALDALRVLT